MGLTSWEVTVPESTGAAGTLEETRAKTTAIARVISMLLFGSGSALGLRAGPGLTTLQAATDPAVRRPTAPPAALPTVPGPIRTASVSARVESPLMLRGTRLSGRSRPGV